MAQLESVSNDPLANPAVDNGVVMFFVDWARFVNHIPVLTGVGPDIESLFDSVRRVGRIVHARAYGDWSCGNLRRDVHLLYHAGFQTVFVPSAQESDCLSDTAECVATIALDAVSLLKQSPRPATVIVAGCGPEIAPLARAVRARGHRFGIIETAPTAAVPRLLADFVLSVTNGSGLLASAAPPVHLEVHEAPLLVDHLPQDRFQDRFGDGFGSAVLSPSTAAQLYGRIDPSALPRVFAEKLPTAEGRSWSYDGNGPQLDEWRLGELRAIIAESALPDAGPLSREECLIEADRLARDTANIHRRWIDFPKDVQKMLVGLSVTRARHVQAQDAASKDPSIIRKLTPVFNVLTHYSKTYEPGFVIGLQRDHEAKHGTWWEDSRYWYDELRYAARLAPDPAAEQNRLLDEVSQAVARWQKASFKNREARAEELQILVRRCFEVGVAKKEPELARRTIPARECFTAKEFKSLREAMKLIDADIEDLDDEGDDNVVRVCFNEECSTLIDLVADPDQEVMMDDATVCAVCGGSNNQRAAMALIKRLRERGLTQVLIVGGTPTQHTELEQLFGYYGIEMRCIYGAEGSYSRNDVTPDLRWAQVLAIWGGTPLPHKVSNLYTDQRPVGLPMAVVDRRGIEALCRELINVLT